MARQSPFMSSAQFTYPSSYQQHDNRYSTGTSVEPAMGLNRRPSLLAGYHNHFGSPERASLNPYYLSLAPVSMGPHVDEHSKRSRYPTNINMSVNSQLLPLSIDIKKEQQVYQPQTEAISPTPDDPKSDSNLRDSTIIRNSISKLESEIEMTTKKLQRAKLSQSEIKSQADKSAADEENDEHDDLLQLNGSQTLIERILHENRRKAEEGQKIFCQLNNNLDLNMPIYQEPIDIESIQQIRTKYLNTMKKHLQLFFKTAHENYKRKIILDSDKYDKIYKKWQKSIEKEEKLIASKDQTNYREIFEKTFPELKKSREDKEKKQNLNESSNIELNSVVNSNFEQETENQEDKLRKSSVVPPVLHSFWQRKHQYFNKNGLIEENPSEFYKERTKMPHWSAEEKQIFIEKFTQSPKNFGFISSFLENKTTEQCVQFYYLTKKNENYKNLLRKQTQGNKRKAKQNATLPTVIESSIPKVSSFASNVGSSSQQMTGSNLNSSGQDFYRTAVDRTENDEDRRENNQTDFIEEKRANKNRCQLLSCTTEKTGKKKNRKNRLRAFPNKWNELTNENREAIRRSLQIPQNVQRCCTRCYEKLIVQVRQRQNNNQPMEEDDEDDESSKMPTTIPNDQDLKQDEEWNENEIDTFTEALHKFGDDWSRIAEYVRRSEQSCRTFYLKYRKKSRLTDEELNIDEDNGSVSGSEDASRRLVVSTKNENIGPIDEENDEETEKAVVNDETVESPRGMVIDEGEDQITIIEEKPKKNDFKPKETEATCHLTTINSLVEKEISKTLHATDKRTPMNRNLSPDKTRISPTVISANQPPPLVTLKRPHSPNTHTFTGTQNNLHLSSSQTSFTPKGSIMRGTPISSSMSPSNKPISIDTSTGHPQSHQFSSPRTDFNQHSSNYHDASHLKTSKINDRNLEASQYFAQQQQQQQQNAYMRHFPSSTQQHKASSINSHSSVSNPNKSISSDSSNTDTFETLRADFVTSRYLTTTHSPNHERSRHPSEQRSPSQTSIASSNSQTLLPPPTVIGPSASNPTMQSSNHHHNSQQQAALLAASQLLASSGMYPQELLASGLLPYPSYYNSMPGAPFYLDPRLMHEFAAVNNEQMKNLRALHPTHTSTHSPPDMPAPYSNSTSKRHAMDTMEHMRYPTAEYSPSMWRSQNSSSTQPGSSIHQQMKSNVTNNENPLLKANELARHQNRLTSATERDARSPDDYHHRLSQVRAPVESPSIHFTRSDLHNYHKSASHEKLNAGLHYSEHPNDNNSVAYLRGAAHVHKQQPTHHSQHFSPHHGSSSNSRPSLVTSSQLSPSQLSNYMLHGLHPSAVGTVSPRQQQQSSPHHSQSHYSQHRHNHPSEQHRNSKDPISIQDYIKQSVHDFLPSNPDSKSSASDLVPTDNPNSQSSRLNQSSIHSTSKVIDTHDQPILIDGDDDSNSIREANESMSMNTGDTNTKFRSNQDFNKHNAVDGDLSERRRDSSIKKILSNQPLEKQEYVEINQKIQNSNVGASKVHSTNEINGLERSNSNGGREPTRSRGSITMRMLMGANGIYADGKAQPMSASELSQDSSNKRAGSPNDKSQSLEYLIRGELDRACPTIPKRDDSSASIFQNRHPSSHSSPTVQQRSSMNQSMSTSKRMRMSPKDDNNFHMNESRNSSQDSSSSVRDPFVLQTQSKSSHHSTNPPSSAASGSNSDRIWQSYVQQQYQHPGNSFASRIPRSGNVASGSITQGSPISPSIRSSHDILQYPSASNNQLVNPRYSYYINKNDPQSSPNSQLFQDHSPKGKFIRRPYQTQTSPSEGIQHEPTSSQNIDQLSNLRSPLNNPQLTIRTSNTPPTMSSPVSSSVSPTTSTLLNNAHSLKKRLISEYEHEQQQRNSPRTISPTVTSSRTTPPPISSSNRSESTHFGADRLVEDISDGEVTVTTSNEQREHST